MDEAISTDSEVYDRMLLKKDEVLSGKAVNRELLEMEYGRLKKNYQTFINSKELIVSLLLTTIEEIRNYIRNSKINLQLNLTDYDPSDFFKQISYSHSDAQEKVNDEYVEDKHDFNSQLLKEVIPL